MNNLLTLRDRQTTNINSHRRTRELDVICSLIVSVLAAVALSCIVFFPGIMSYAATYLFHDCLIMSLVIVLRVQGLEFS
jgi:hypothetical protein